MDSPGSGDTDDVSSENDSVETCHRYKKFAQNSFQFPLSVREGKSDDLILLDNVSGKLWFGFQFRS